MPRQRDDAERDVVRSPFVINPRPSHADHHDALLGTFKKQNLPRKAAAASAPPAPQNAARKLGLRSGVKRCSHSSTAEMAMRAAPTISGRGQARQTIDVTAK